MGVMGFIKQETTSKKVEQSSTIVPKDFRHSLCIGQTGCGKTSSYIYPNLEDRIKNGYGIMLVDYKGHEHKSVKYIANKYLRSDDVLEIGVPWTKNSNLITYFNEKELKKFVISLMELSAENSYWSESASNIIVSIWKSIKLYNEVVEAADDINNKKSYQNVVERFKLPTDLTFTEIVNATKSVNKIANFLKKMQTISLRFMSMTKKKIEDYYEKYGKEAAQEKYLLLFSKCLNFKSLVANDLKSLEVFKDAVEDTGNRSTSLQTLMMAMGTTLSSVAGNKMFNDANGVDIVKALNDGKIIVVNSQELTNVVLASFTGSILNELSKRSGQTNINPISVFIDEAQRVLSPEIDLYVDVLRSAKVEMYLAFQNISLMQEALGKTKLLALVQNLSTSFHFKNALDYEDLETSKLDTFQYYKNGVDKVHTAKAIFLDKDEVFDVEIEYFELNGIYEKLYIDSKDRDKVIEFNPHLFQQGKINLVSRDGKVKTIKLRNKENELQALEEMGNIMDLHMSNMQRNGKTRAEVTEDLFSKKQMDRLNKFMGIEEEE